MARAQEAAGPVSEVEMPLLSDRLSTSFQEKVSEKSYDNSRESRTVHELAMSHHSKEKKGQSHVCYYVSEQHIAYRRDPRFLDLQVRLLWPTMTIGTSIIKYVWYQAQPLTYKKPLRLQGGIFLSPFALQAGRFGHLPERLSHPEVG